MQDQNKNDETQGEKIIDVQVEEARLLAQLQRDINAKFLGAPKDLKIWGRLVDEIKTRAAEIGFVVDVYPKSTEQGAWIPVCDIIGRTDKRLEQFLQEQGPDIEHKSWDAKRVSSSELEDEGVDTNLLM